MPLPKREDVNVFETMMKSAFVDWLKEKETVHHNNYHVLLEEGPLDPLMQFLTGRAMCPEPMTCLTSLTHIPIDTPRY
jgi:hypothetical protein